MEGVYLKGKSVDWASENINLNDYFDKFYEATRDCFFQGGTEASHIQSLMDIPLTDEQFATLSERCSPDLLAVAGENPLIDVRSVHRNSTYFEKTKIPSDVDLETFNVLRKRTHVQEEYINARLKYKNQIYLSEECRKLKADIVPGSEFLVSVRIHLPFFSMPVERRRHKLTSCSQEIILTGSNTLSILRDVIVCMEEFGDINGDVSESPSAPVKLRLKDAYKSGLFYIGNTFYTDHRHPDNLDYSAVIRSWAAKRRIVMNHHENMEVTRVNDLVLRFGYPYVYQHLGNCEHLLIFSDARLIHPEDILARQQYPMYMSLSMKCAKYCGLCGNTIARYIVTSSDKLTRDPSFLCERCLKSYLYIDDKKVGSFKAYRFYDRRAML